MSSSFKAPSYKIVLPSSSVEVSACIDTLASSFKSVPCTHAFSIESSRESTVDPVHEYVDRTVRHSLHAGAALVASGDTSAVALWELPHDSSITRRNERSETQNTVRNGSVKKEWEELVQRGKEKYIGLYPNNTTPATLSGVLLPHYHLDFLGRNPNVPKVRGAISAVVVPFLEMARKEGRNVWLEATSLDVVLLYQHFGFVVMEEITVGYGRFNSQGVMQKGGPGVKAWLMMIDNST